MSNLNFDFAENDFRPLAAKMRPTSLEQYFGQSHLIGEGKPLRKAIQAGHIHSMIFSHQVQENNACRNYCATY